MRILRRYESKKIDSVGIEVDLVAYTKGKEEDGSVIASIYYPDGGHSDIEKWFPNLREFADYINVKVDDYTGKIEQDIQWNSGRDM